MKDKHLITYTQQRLLIQMKEKEKPVLSNYFNLFYKHPDSKRKSIANLIKRNYVTSRKDIFGSDKRKKYYQLTTKGLVLAQLLRE